MAKARQNGLVSATERFITACSWLTDEDLPAVATLQLIAAQVDAEGVVPALMGPYGVAYRALLARAPSGPGEVDPLDAELEEAGGMGG